jgi:CTP:molybdopterin cytidylyltransferase MocA
LADTGAIVLAAGAGTRFGDCKQLAPLRGRPLLEHALEAAWGAAAIDRFVVVLGAGAERVRAEADLSGYEVVVCRDWEEGVAASLRAGVAALGDVGAAVVLLGDMPGVTAQVVAGALDHLRPRDDALRTLAGGAPTHPVVLGPRALAAVPALRGDVGARALFAELEVREWEAGHLFDATDVDTPADLASVRPPGERLSAGAQRPEDRRSAPRG